MPTMSDISPTLRPVARLLPPEEWAAHTPEFQALSPDYGFVVVVEDGGPGGAILARWAAFNTAHVEGLALAPEAQGHAGVGRALLSFMVQHLYKQGVTEVLTQADSPEVAALIKGVGGTRVPGETWVIPLTKAGER